MSFPLLFKDVCLTVYVFIRYVGEVNRRPNQVKNVKFSKPSFSVKDMNLVQIFFRIQESKFVIIIFVRRLEIPEITFKIHQFCWRFGHY